MYNKYLINDICDVGSSKRIYLSEYQNNGIPFYRGKEIIEKESNKEISNELYISYEKYNEIKEKFGVPKNGDILMTAVGTIGISWLVNESKFYFKDGNLIWFKNFKEDKVNNKYLYYTFKSEKFKKILKNISIGSTQKAITIEQIKKIEWFFPKINIQNKIVQILEKIDNKIKLNNQINDNLYEINKQLYKSWFVDYEFPNENGKPYKTSGGRMVESELGEMPESWECKYLDELVNIVNGYSYKGKELVEKSSIGMATIKNFERNGGFKLDGYKALNPDKIKEEQIVELLDLVVAHTDLTQNADIIGNPILILNKGGFKKIVISMDLVKVVPKINIYKKFFIFEILNSEKFKKHALGYVSGTTVLHLDKSCIKKYEVAIPSNELIEKFSKIIETNYEKISELIAENQKLEQLRDTLLPKLMNGEIDLENVEI